MSPVYISYDYTADLDNIDLNVQERPNGSLHWILLFSIGFEL